jgi:hypothetical protein
LGAVKNVNKVLQLQNTYFKVIKEVFTKSFYHKVFLQANRIAIGNSQILKICENYDL